jgi:DNA primase
VPSDPVELTRQIKAASDIVAVVGSYLALRPSGATFKALCPFHPDTRPSLDVDPRRQRYRCWSCGAHGDVFAFVQQMEKVSFAEARAVLAGRAGIKLDESPTPQDRHRSRLLEVMRWAEAKYQHVLLEEPIAEPARTYLGSRKLSGKTVRDFGLGFAPNPGNWLVRLAAAERVPTELLAEVGLVLNRHENRGFFDRFCDRIMFPIRDVRGQTVAFGGRILPGSPYAGRVGKYINSAETPLFHKSDILYGLDKARHAGAAVGYLAVVEGYTDVLMAHQCGVPQVVATLGTALNARHVAQLRRYVPRVVLVYDADAAGLSGVDRALEIFVAHDVELAVATLPEGLDPCDLLVRPGGVETFNRLLASAVDALDFKLNRLLERNGSSSVEATRRVVDEVLGVMAAAPPLASRAAQVKQELIVTRLAHRLGLRQETVWSRLGELRAQRRRREQATAYTPRGASPPRPPAGSPSAPAGTADTAPASASPSASVAPATAGRKAAVAVAAERQLLEILLADPGLVPRAAAALAPDELTHTGLRRLLRELYAVQASGRLPDLDALRERLADRPDLFDSALKLQFVGQHMQDREQWLGRLLKRFAELKLEAEHRRLRERLASASGDEATELLRRLQEVAKPGAA